MSENVNVAIAGLGNCANSLIQGVDYYREADTDAEIPGIMNVRLGDYHIGDVEFVAAFDVDATKVGQDIAKAMWAGENNTIRFADVAELGIEVLRGPTLDGIGEYYRGVVEESPEEPVDVAQALRESGTDVIV
jgi:myo-inositol-1-phosphate synthase